METTKGKGYISNKMSVNASLAYDNDEMPKSKWTKKAIIEFLSEERPDLVEKAQQQPHYILVTFLTNTSIHHTGALFNQTRFWSFQTDWFANADQAEFDKIIEARKARNSKTIAEQTELKRQKEARQLMRTTRERQEKLFKFSSYKTLKGFLNGLTPKLEAELTAKRAEKIVERREQLRETWTKQGYRYGLEKIEDDDFIEDYIKLKWRINEPQSFLSRLSEE